MATEAAVSVPRLGISSSIGCPAGLCTQGWVTPIQVASNTAGPPIRVGTQPDAIAITP